MPRQFSYEVLIFGLDAHLFLFQRNNIFIMNAKVLVFLMIVISIFSGLYYLNLMLSKPSIKDIKPEMLEKIKEIYGEDVGLDEITYEERCYVCDINGCRFLERPCIKAEIKRKESEEGERPMGGGSSGPGGISGGGVAIDPGTGEMIETKDCYHYETYNLPGERVTYINYGCNNPTPTCNSENKCVYCSASEECVQKVLIEEEDRKMRVYEIIGTPLKGSYNLNTGICSINDSVMVVFNKSVSMEECESLILKEAVCNDGICEFI